MHSVVSLASPSPYHTMISLIQPFLLLGTLLVPCRAFVPPRRSAAGHRVAMETMLLSAFDEYDMSDPEQTLAFQDDAVGTGEVAEKGKMVTVAYKGTLLADGTPFDSDMFGISFRLGDGRVISGGHRKN